MPLPFILCGLSVELPVAERKTQDSPGLWAAGHSCTGCSLHKVCRQGDSGYPTLHLQTFHMAWAIVTRGRKQLFLICIQILYELVTA